MKGLELSLDDFLKDLVVEGQIGDRPAKPRILLLDLLHPLGLANLQPAILAALRVVGLRSVTLIESAAGTVAHRPCVAPQLPTASQQSLQALIYWPSFSSISKAANNSNKFFSKNSIGLLLRQLLQKGFCESIE